MHFYYSPQVKFLLITESKEKEIVGYENLKIKLPIIGPRPPYYTNPRYEPYYPVV